MTAPAWYRDGDECILLVGDPRRFCPACERYPLDVLANPDWPVALLCRDCGYQEAVEVGGEA